ncbi:hypothetical protein B0H34DRAFT_793936 [Crassisporium funariophilum]|nr:hypothetical protein B0H34DRAFT_793936 [Crassisporium funariophilum]
MSQAFQSMSERVLPQSEGSTTKMLASANQQVSEVESSSKPVSKSNKSTKAFNSKAGPSSRARASQSQQPSAATLGSMGIKVRDFAYESTLPPIRPIFRHPRQIQPGVVRANPLKRERTETEDDEPFSQQSQEDSQRDATKLERTSTEPAIVPTTGNAPPARMRAFVNLEDFENHDYLHLSSQKSEAYLESPKNSQMPPSTFDSQDSAPHIHTPLVTPNGSLQWNITNIPVPTSPLDAKHQDKLSTPNSQRGISQTSKPSQLNASPTPSSPLTPIPSSPSNFTPSSPTPISSTSYIQSTKQTSSLGKRRMDSSHEIPHAAITPRILATRYQLRKRPAPSSPPASPTKAPSRARGRGATTSLQTFHSRPRPTSDSGSTSPRALRQRATKTVTTGREKRRRVG